MRRRKKELGQKVQAVPCRDLAIPAAGIADGGPITDDVDLDLGVDGAISAPGAVSAPVGDQAIIDEDAFGMLRFGNSVATKEETWRRGHPS